jgi:hypothetical protein
MSITPCPLCKSNEARFFYHAFNREYHRCSNCFLVFVPSEYYTAQTKENNSLNTDFKVSKKFRKVGEKQYFTLLTNPVLKRASEGAMGLDFNCGESSKVEDIFKKNGKLVKVYDEDHKPNKIVLEDSYDFITVIHQIETYKNPREKFDQFYELLSAQGSILALWTTPLEDLSSFNSWPFIKQPHHINFFHEDTFKWIAKKYNYEIEFLGDGIVIFTQN